MKMAFVILAIINLIHYHHKVDLGWINELIIMTIMIIMATIMIIIFFISVIIIDFIIVIILTVPLIINNKVVIRVYYSIITFRISYFLKFY